MEEWRQEEKEEKEPLEDVISAGKGEEIKGEVRGREGQLEIEEGEACWVQEEEDERKRDWVETVQEDPWTEEWMEFKVPREYAEKEWNRKVYRKPPYWGKIGEKERGLESGDSRRPRGETTDHVHGNSVE